MMMILLYSILSTQNIPIIYRYKKADMIMIII